MSNKWFYGFIVFVLINYSFYSQNVKSGEIIYQKQMIIDQEKVTAKDVLSKGVAAISSKHTYVLLFNENRSKFTFQDNMDNESSSKDKYYSKLAYILCNDYNYYYDKVNDKGGVIEYGDGILIADTVKLDWIITNENKMIGEYLCYKATYLTRMKNYKGVEKEILITAWFAPSIPISFGPKKYKGLPGLILELQDQLSIVYATNIKLKEIIDAKIVFPNGEVISEDEYAKKMKAQMGM
jgi:GLPGLI family protein